jgi:hypothetical protein
MKIIAKTRFAVGLGALALLCAPLAAEDDIIWPTYSQVVHTGDSTLTCSQLRAAIDHVSSDIAMLDKARDRVQDTMKTGFDLDRYRSTTQQGRATFIGNGGGEEIYPKAREEIVASKKVARDRRNHLRNLLLFCTDAPGATPGPASR